MWYIVWVSPQGHISFCMHRSVPVPCENGLAETTLAEGGRNPVAALSISLTITDNQIWWPKKYHTIKTRVWRNSHCLKIQDGGCHFEFRINVNNSGLDKDVCTKLHGKMHYGHAKITTWPKVETGSSFTWRHQINVWSVCASISVTITDIWTKYGTEHKISHYQHSGMAKFT